MTIGQRIAKTRKELGLSQEGLGDRLGVSRQSIYKWESNAALPEIDKLIALSKLFGVSVGWLLGVEDAPSESAAPEEAAPESGGELSDAQLKLVEEIVGRYLEIRPKPDLQRWKRFFRRGAAVFLVLLFACFFAIFSLFARLDRMDDQYNSLQSSMHHVTGSVNSQISFISDQMEALLKAQNDLTADCGTEVTATDYMKNTVTFSVRAVPKTYVEGLTAVFLADSGSGPAEFPAELCPDREFSGEITTELTDNITLSVVLISPDGTRQTQLLDTYDGLYSESIPRVDIMTNMMWAALPAPDPLVLTTASPWYISLAGGSSCYTGARVGLFKNRRLAVWAEPCPRPSCFQCFSVHEYRFFSLPDLTLPLAAGDEFCVAAVVTDEYGRVFVTPEYIYTLDGDGADLTSVYSSEVFTGEGWQLE